MTHRPPDALIAERMCGRCDRQLVAHCREPGHWPPCCPGECPARQTTTPPPLGEWRRVIAPVSFEFCGCPGDTHRDNCPTHPRWEIGEGETARVLTDAAIRTFGRKWVERTLGRIGAPPLPETAWEADR